MTDYDILEWDSDFFGFAVARVRDSARSEVALARALAALRAGGVRLAYWLPERSDESERIGRALDGTALGGRIHYSCEIVASLVPPSAEVTRYSLAQASPELERLAVAAGGQSRFVLDPAMPAGSGERMFRTWIRRAVAHEIAFEVLIARGPQGSIAGMATLAAEGATGVIGLIAVHDAAHGRGVGRTLMRAAHHEFSGRRLVRARIVTQERNVAACRLYEACGYRPERRESVFHFWL